jgi:putative membrane protein
MRSLRLVPAIALGTIAFSLASAAWAQAADSANQMNHYYWNDWYFGWGWVLWIGFLFLMFSSFGNWGYSYRAHKKFDEQPRRDATDILNERYARGEITREQYVQLKSDISKA